MSGTTQALAAGSAEVKAAIGRGRYADQAVTVVGYGNMGRQFVQALRRLGVDTIRVCSRSGERMTRELSGVEGVECIAGGFERLSAISPRELAIIATPTLTLLAATRHLAEIGCRRLLIEKPVSLYSPEIDALATDLEARGIEAACAYNRVAYASLVELRAHAARDGGVRSCVYTMTEMVNANWPERFPAEELARWGIANSEHVMSLAHALIGLPAQWQARQLGQEIPWHPTGSIFVGSGVSEDGVPFAWHADWGSKGRWSVEAFTAQAVYRLCPLEQLARKPVATGEWEPVAVDAFAPDLKAGLVEEVAAMLSSEVRELVPPMPLARAASLTRFAEDVFGYSHE